MAFLTLKSKSWLTCQAATKAEAVREEARRKGHQKSGNPWSVLSQFINSHRYCSCTLKSHNKPMIQEPEQSCEMITQEEHSN